MTEGFDDVPLPGLDTLDPGKPRSRRSVDPTLRPTDAARAAFWRRVVKAPGDGCWIFTGAISSPDGYGRIAWRDDGRERTVSAHRFALELAYGVLGDDVVAEHRCNEPLCVRVDAQHVICSTQRDNMRYAAACGRVRGPGDKGTALDRVARSLAVRSAVAGGWNPDAYDTARRAGRAACGAQQVLFDE